jgi:hypothetical protein
MRWIIVLTGTLACHVLLGWRWDLLGGIAAGWLWIRGGWWRGAVIVGLVWLGLVVYSILVAEGPALELHHILAGMAGDIPTWSIPVVVVVIGLLIGATGGLIGSRLRGLVKSKRLPSAVVRDTTDGDSS